MYFCAPKDDELLASVWSDSAEDANLFGSVWSEISAPRAQPADARERAHASCASFAAPPPGGVLETLGTWAQR